MNIFAKMKRLSSFWGSITAGAAAAGITLGAGCAQFNQRAEVGSFASVQPVIESNCVHCHGTNRLGQMPSFSDSGALASLIGPNKWIVPRHPERSRFFHIAIYGDAHPTAMPPTGHAMSGADIETLRAWISAGAPLPEGAPVILKPRGKAPRSS